MITMTTNNDDGANHVLAFKQILFLNFAP